MVVIYKKEEHPDFRRHIITIIYNQRLYEINLYEEDGEMKDFSVFEVNLPESNIDGKVLNVDEKEVLEMYKILKESDEKMFECIEKMKKEAIKKSGILKFLEELR